MNYNYKQTNFSLAVLGGLFAGLIASAACEVYNVIFRYSTGYDHADSINVETLIFAPVFFTVAAGIAYFIITKFIKSRVFYTVFILLITLACAIEDFWMKPGDEVGNIPQFKELVLGIIIIVGAIGSFVLPYVTRHDALAD